MSCVTGVLYAIRTKDNYRRFKGGGQKTIREKSEVNIKSYKDVHKFSMTTVRVHKKSSPSLESTKPILFKTLQLQKHYAYICVKFSSFE